MRTLALIAVAALCFASCASRPPDADPKRAAAAAELDRLAGTWILVDGYLDGQKVSEVDHSRITWTGNRISTASPQLKATAVPYLSAQQIVATIAVDPTTSPRQMDTVYDADPGRPALAIYEWLGEDRYRICIDRLSQGRPTSFASAPGTGRTLHVWLRQGK